MAALLIAVLLLGAALAFAPVALANTTASANWAGYAVHRTGVSFRRVSATWTQPEASCVAGRSTYSAVWIGIGGFRQASHALEQIGTEVDCDLVGHAVSSAWYELVPGPSRTIFLAVDPGDLMHATLTVVGHAVTLDLENLTRHRGFHKRVYAPSVDVSSAEWIVEAPSECITQLACQALPLADFGSVTFDSAAATSTTGVTGSVTATRWWRTKIKLTPGAQQFIVARKTSDTAGTATPSALRGGGSEFDVTYSTVVVRRQQFLGARRSRLRAAHIEH
jgi:Peptidase A4 family